ncbi:MAG: AraC family transcriptional regulator [Gammaproteobacteria bacterium]
MDALSDVLRTVRLKGGVFLHAEFTDPWCLGAKIDPGGLTRFLGETAEFIPYHYVVEGHLRMRMDTGHLYELGPGGLVLLPRNDYHVLGGDLRLTPTPSREVVQPAPEGGLASVRMGGAGARTRIVCGFLCGEKLLSNPVVSALPPVLQLDYREGTSAAWIRNTFSYAADEIAAGRMGSEVVFAKISELLFVEAIRRYTESLPEGQTGWLAGLRDPFLARALAVLHERLRDPWTVDELGREVGLARSALTERFTQVIGVPPMQYLANWRIQVAAQELLNSSKTIPAIAQDIGYETEASFTRAFKRWMGAPPATWRRQHK